MALTTEADSLACAATRATEQMPPRTGPGCGREASIGIAVRTAKMTGLRLVGCHALAASLLRYLSNR
jgi:hypothetical protein